MTGKSNHRHGARPQRRGNTRCRGLGCGFESVGKLQCSCPNRPCSRTLEASKESAKKKKKKERMWGNSREKHVCDVKKSKCGKQAGSECSASNIAGGENKGWFKEHGWELKHTSSGVGYCALVGRYVPVAPLCCQFWIVSERLVPSGRSNPALSTGTALQKKAAFCRGMGTTTMSQ